MGIYQLQIRLNRILNWFGRNRVYSLNKDEEGINLGCDIETPRSFVGVDGSFLILFVSRPFFPRFLKSLLYSKSSSKNHYSFVEFLRKVNNSRIIHHDLKYGIPFKNDSVEYIFSSHFLEHLDEKSAGDLLKECNRVLKKGGIIRIIVPDLDEEIDEICFNLENYKKNRDVIKVQKYVTSSFENEGEFSYHRKMYNFEALKEALASAGFKNVKKKKRFEGLMPKLRKLDIRDGLIVEARKD